MHSNDTAISVRNLSKTYRLFNHPGDRVKQFLSLGIKKYHNEFTALDDISFNIKKGEAIGIIGRNGSGKSTLLQLICGILKPTNGSVRTNGRISALLELGAGFNPEFTGRENVYFHGALHGISKPQTDARFEKIREFADIGEFIEQPVRTYSSGMFIRLAFSAAIHTDADILIVDEALAVGDESFQRKCFDKLTEYLNNKNKILILVSHNTRQIERTCSRVAWLEQGRMLAIGPSSEVCNAYQINYQQKTLQQSSKESKNTPTPVISTEHLDVKRVWLCNEECESPVDEIIFQSPLRIIIEFECHLPLNNPDIIIEIQTPDQIPIAAANISCLPNAFNFPIGQHRVECTFEKIIMQPGNYQLKIVFLGSYRNFLWEGRNLCTFQVSPVATMNMVRTPASLVNIPFEWQIIS